MRQRERQWQLTTVRRPLLSTIQILLRASSLAVPSSIIAITNRLAIPIDACNSSSLQLTSRATNRSPRVYYAQTDTVSHDVSVTHRQIPSVTTCLLRKQRQIPSFTTCLLLTVRYRQSPRVYYSLTDTVSHHVSIT